MNENLHLKGEKLKVLLNAHRDKFSCVIQPPLSLENTFELHLSDSNNIVSKIDPSNADLCWQVIKQTLADENKVAAIGGYAEKRTAYRINPSLFGENQDERCIHLGVDIWMEVGTPIYAPLDAVVHSFADNAGIGNYGPTIILQHVLEKQPFFTLYGHLNRQSLIGLYPGKKLKRGESFAAIGSPAENGNWSPHLHYQIIADMMDCSGDFIGVSTEADSEFYLTLCPEPVVL